MSHVSPVSWSSASFPACNSLRTVTCLINVWNDGSPLPQQQAWSPLRAMPGFRRQWDVPGMASFLFLGGWRAHVPGLSAERQGSLTSPWPYSLLPAPPHNHLFSYFHQQPNYWSFKVSAWCFCVRDNRMCSPAPAPPRTCFAQGCASARDRLVWVVGLGTAGWVCCFERAWVRLPGACGSSVGVCATPAGDLGWGCSGFPRT